MLCQPLNPLSLRKQRPKTENLSPYELSRLVLLGWSVYEPTKAPSLDYLQHRRGADIFGTNKDDVVPANEAAWNALLDDYGFSRMDEFDLTLLDGIRNGFFDPSLLEKYASPL